jgi:hypothetical protein
VGMTVLEGGAVAVLLKRSRPPESDQAGP